MALHHEREGSISVAEHATTLLQTLNSHMLSENFTIYLHTLQQAFPSRSIGWLFHHQQSSDARFESNLLAKRAVRAARSEQQLKRHNHRDSSLSHIDAAKRIEVNAGETAALKW